MHRNNMEKIGFCDTGKKSVFISFICLFLFFFSLSAKEKSLPPNAPLLKEERLIPKKEKGDALYEAKAYKKALAIYQEIAVSKPSKDLFIKISRCYHHLNIKILVPMTLELAAYQIIQEEGGLEYLSLDQLKEVVDLSKKIAILLQDLELYHLSIAAFEGFIKRSRALARKSADPSSINEKIEGAEKQIKELQNKQEKKEEEARRPIALKKVKKKQIIARLALEKPDSSIYWKIGFFLGITTGIFAFFTHWLWPRKSTKRINTKSWKAASLLFGVATILLSFLVCQSMAIAITYGRVKEKSTCLLTPTHLVIPWQTAVKQTDVFFFPYTPKKEYIIIPLQNISNVSLLRYSKEGFLIKIEAMTHELEEIIIQIGNAKNEENFMSFHSALHHIING